MSAFEPTEENPENEKNNPKFDFLEDEKNDEVKITSVAGMFKNWFLDYASYVILERAVPALLDGLKPVQRRILHSMKEMDDGRYSKVANIIGNTMKYHPHGDAAISEAMVQLGQKDLLIDMQGNWGNILTGDSAAAARYIEARLSKFAKEVVFNPKTTQYIPSYDGRNQEPVYLPIKFPLLLAQGAEGIAVGMACKILPHNFLEIIEASIAVLKGENFTLLPDFPTGAMMDASGYNDGLRGGKIRLRARIKKEKNDLIIHEIPFGTTTSSLIESIVKANEKGKIKIKKIEDNTAENAEIYLHLASGVSQDKTIDALYAFTDCELSISPNTAIIDGEKPRFLGVSELLKISTENTLQLLKKELEIQATELSESHYFLSLEKIFIEKKIYIDFDGKTYEQAKTLTLERITPLIEKFYRPIEEKDIEKLLELRMRRITKHDAEKANEELLILEEKLAQTQHHLAHLIPYAIDYFKQLKKNHAVGKNRKTEIKFFDTIQARAVVSNNRKLYIDRVGGFIGFGLKKEEFIADCSDLDDVLVILDNGQLILTPIAEKKFVGQNILYANIWKKTEANRIVYHLIYRDGEKGYPMGKRFWVKSLIRDKTYELTRGTPGTHTLYFSVHPNGEREILTVKMQPIGGLKKLEFDFDFSQLPIKTMSHLGQKLTNRIIKSIEQKMIGDSTLAAEIFFYDPSTQRLNTEEKGRKIGEFAAEDLLFCVHQSGYFQLLKPDRSLHFENDLIHIQKYDPNEILGLIYWDGQRESVFGKRIQLENIPLAKKQYFLNEHPKTKLLFQAIVKQQQFLELNIDMGKGKENVQKKYNWEEISELRSLNALGKDLGKIKIKSIKILKNG